MLILFRQPCQFSSCRRAKQPVQALFC
jgi:hypothetical protein